MAVSRNRAAAGPPEPTGQRDRALIVGRRLRRPAGRARSCPNCRFDSCPDRVHWRQAVGIPGCVPRTELATTMRCSAPGSRTCVASRPPLHTRSRRDPADPARLVRAVRSHRKPCQALSELPVRRCPIRGHWTGAGVRVVDRTDHELTSPVRHRQVSTGRPPVAQQSAVPVGATFPRAVDRPPDRGRQRDEDDLGALADHPKHPVAVPFTEVGDVGGVGVPRRTTRRSLPVAGRRSCTAASTPSPHTSCSTELQRPRTAITLGAAGSGERSRPRGR
jgi:hypothetical protein